MLFANTIIIFLYKGIYMIVIMIELIVKSKVSFFTENTFFKTGIELFCRYGRRRYEIKNSHC